MSHTEEIPITKVAISHVVGKGGETIKKLKADTNTKIDIVDDKVVIVGEPADCQKAKTLIEAILAEQANPDYEGPEGKRLRGEADALGNKRDEVKKEADAKFAAGDKDGGHKLMAEAKSLGEQMHAKNKEAAAAIVKNRNDGKGDAYLDLHGLRTEEALEVTKARIAELEAKSADTELELIPGAGHHSAPGKVALKPACENLLKELGLAYKDASAGSFMVTVVGKGNKSGAPAASTPAPAAAAPVAAAEPTPAAQPAASAKPAAATASSQPAADKQQKDKERKCCSIM